VIITSRHALHSSASLAEIGAPRCRLAGWRVVRLGVTTRVQSSVSSRAGRRSVLRTDQGQHGHCGEPRVDSTTTGRRCRVNARLSCVDERDLVGRRRRERTTYARVLVSRSQPPAAGFRSAICFS